MRKGQANGYDQFIMAMISQSQGRRNEARSLFEKAVAWARQDERQQNRKIGDLRMLWSDAARLLKRPGPTDTTGPPP